MRENFESVHVHSIDERGVIEEFKQRGFVLHERTNPTIIAQMGFIKLIFVRDETVELNKNAYLG